MIINEQQINKETLINIANKMALAARTAPKGRGTDLLEILILTEGDIQTLATKMKEIGEKEELNAFSRDSGNIAQAPVVLLLGTRTAPLGLKKCGLCGFANCAEQTKNKGGRCAFNTGDLGIAIGSAVSIAADNRVDNRIMYTAGLTAIELGLFPSEVEIAYAIPISATGKNPFFDRK